MNDINNTNNTTAHLPTAKEYIETVNNVAVKLNAEWSEPKYQCPKCGGGMCKNMMIVLASYPEQYVYKCDKCGHIEYQFI